MINLRTLFYGTAGAARLLRLNKSGIDLIIKGTDGFWASLIWPIILIAPLYFLLMLLRFNPDQTDFFRYMVVHAEFYIIAWLIFPVIMERFCHFTQTAHKYLDFIISYNWLSALYNTFFLLVGLAQATNMLELNTAGTISVLLMFAGFLWIGNLAKHTLELPISTIAGIVVIELALGVVLSSIRAHFLFV